MAEWSGGGLQILLPQFKSGCRLIYKKQKIISFFAAIPSRIFARQKQEAEEKDYNCWYLLY